MAETGTKRKTCDSLENQRQAYKKILSRTRKFQLYLSEMCHVISNHAVKVAGLRDKNDELAKCLDSFTKVEEFSTTSKLAMAVAAELVATVGDHQDLAVQRIETMVLPNISSYGRICDCVKADVWNAIQAIKREKVKRKSANVLRKKSKDPKIKKAYDDALRELERASAETSRLCQLSQEQVIKFEHKRLMDLKESLGNFLKIQITTHAKSLELLSQTYKHIQSIDEDGDLDILTSLLKLGDDDNGPSRKKSASLKSTKSNTKLKEDKTMNDSLSGSTSGYTTDSSHSEIVRHIEKVLKSTRSGDGDGFMKNTSPKSSKKLETDNKISKTKLIESHRSNHVHVSESISNRKRTDVKIDKSDKRHSSHSINSPRIDSATAKQKQPVTKQKEDNEDSDSYLPLQAKTFHSIRSSQRPTTPSRPITVPTRMSSPEDLSSSRAELEFRFRNKSTRYGQPQKRTSQLGDYYYSMSEEDRSRGAYSLGKRNSRDVNVKHVSFKSNSMSSRPQQEYTIQRTSAANYSQNPYDRQTSNSYNCRDAQMLFSPVKSSLKKYC